jgi:alcohol dehydrogenase class IV
LTETWTHTAYAQQIVFGAGALDRLPDLVKVIGARRTMLVTTAGRLASEEGERVVSRLGRSLISTFAEVASHVPAPLVQAAALQARRDGIDSVVSFGGGSCADLGKAVCFFLEQESGMPGATHVDRPAIGHIAIPTTYSGAELTPFFGMTDPQTHQKQGTGGPTLAPLAAIYDVELTMSTPRRVSAETGLNALAHCVEAAYSPRRTPEAEAIALAGMARLHRSLPAVIDDPADVDARSDALAGACLAARCLHNAGMGVHHGLAQLLGGRTGIPHGLANALLLAHAVRFNAEAVPDDVARIGDALGRPDDAAGAIADLVTRLGLPSRLSEAGVGQDDLDAVVRLSQGNRNVSANPRPVTEDDVRAILMAAF